MAYFSYYLVPLDYLSLTYSNAKIIQPIELPQIEVIEEGPPEQSSVGEDLIKYLYFLP